MTSSGGSGYDRLFELFSWENRASVYRVRFADGEEYELTHVLAGQDEGEAPHASATVVRTIRRLKAEDWPQRNDIFFRLPEVAEVAEARTVETLFRAV